MKLCEVTCAKLNQVDVIKYSTVLQILIAESRVYNYHDYVLPSCLIDFERNCGGKS